MNDKFSKAAVQSRKKKKVMVIWINPNPTIGPESLIDLRYTGGSVIGLVCEASGGQCNIPQRNKAKNWKQSSE